MTEIILCMLIAVLVAIPIYHDGKDEGRKEFYKGEVVCQERLDKTLDCWRKESLNKIKNEKTE